MSPAIHSASVELTRWLRMAVDRCRLMPKEIYIDLGVDAGTWSRWTSLEDDRTPPLSELPIILAHLDETAWQEFMALVQSLKAQAPTTSTTTPNVKALGTTRA